MADALNQVTVNSLKEFYQHTYVHSLIKSGGGPEEYVLKKFFSGDCYIQSGLKLALRTFGPF